MKRYIWNAPRDRQVWFLNSLFSLRNISMTKERYRMIKNIFTSGSGITLDDLKPKVIELLILKIFYFKFEKSCSNAKYVRCGKKKGYENVHFLLGEWNDYDLFRNLRKYRPDIVESGLNIIETYIRNEFNNDYAPILHRKHDKGNYAWDNIEIMPRKQHDELTKLERERKKELANSI